MARVDITITNDDGKVAVLSQAFEFQDPAPTITSVAPAFGPVAGGTQVLITGTGFRAGLSVDVGGRPATVVSVTSTEVVAVTPSML